MGVIRKEPCPQCRARGEDKSGDNLNVYEGGGKYCFACEYVEPSPDYQEEKFISTMEDFSKEDNDALKARTTCKANGLRGIRDDIYTYFGVRHQLNDKNQPTKQYYPNTLNYELSGYKIRILPKTFSAIGTVAKECDLFGQFRFKDVKGKYVVVTGGEIDQLSAFQMLRDYTLSKGGKYDDIPVVSPVTGETSAFKQLQQNYEWFDRFERIILCFDNDKAGKEATEKASKVLPKGKVYTMDMIHKDPNVYLTEHKERDWINCFFNAKPYTPAGVHASTVLYKAACDNLDQGVLSLPPFMRKAASMLGDGLVKQEISLFLAKTSIGKTTLMSALTEWWALNEPNEVLGVLSLEATAPKYSRNLLSYYLKVPLHRIKDPEERKAFLEKPEITEKINRLYVRDDGRPTFYLCDDRGANTDQIKEKILEMIIKLGVTVLMIDPYSDLLSGMSVPEQEDLATWLKKIMKEYGITIVVVSHVRKSSNNSDDQITEDSAQGSSFLVKAAGQTIALERDKQSECPVERNRTKITILKNRDFSETGPAGSIYYDIDTASLYDYDEWILKHPKEETVDF